MHEVLFRREIMCATRFDEWGHTFENDWTKHHQTRLCHMEAQTRSMSLRRWLEKLYRFCFQTWHFCEEGVWQKGWNPIYDGLSWWITPVISRWTGWHTHQSTTESRDKVSFSFTQGIPVYSKVPIRHIQQCTVYGTDGPSKWRPLSSLLVPKKW